MFGKRIPARWWEPRHIEPFSAPRKRSYESRDLRWVGPEWGDDVIVWANLDYTEKQDVILGALGRLLDLSSVRDGMEALRICALFSWQIGFSPDGEGDIEAEQVTGWAGDSNCHHFKPYDPADGHGFSYVEEGALESLPEAMIVAAVRASGVPVDTITGTDWDDGRWVQCPYCGDLGLARNPRHNRCALREAAT